MSTLRFVVPIEVEVPQGWSASLHDGKRLELVSISALSDEQLLAIAKAPSTKASSNPCNSTGDRYGLYCVLGTEGCDVHDEYPVRLGRPLDNAVLVKKLYEACLASWALGNKIYHNANAHEAEIDWATTRRLLADALGK